MIDVGNIKCQKLLESYDSHQESLKVKFQRIVDVHITLDAKNFDDNDHSRFAKFQKVCRIHSAVEPCSL